MSNETGRHMGRPLQEIISILQNVHDGALATNEEGGPFVSAAGFLYEEAWGSMGKIYFLLSDLARHTKNLLKDPRAAFLVVESNRETPIHERKRLTLKGQVVRVDPTLQDRLKTRYLQIFPRSQMFFQLPDFRFYELRAEELHWIGGFGKAAVLSNKTGDDTIPRL